MYLVFQKEENKCCDVSIMSPWNFDMSCKTSILKSSKLMRTAFDDWSQWWTNTTSFLKSC